MNKLEDKVVVITGVTSGIGRAIAKAFAAEGAKIGMGARNEQKGKALVEEITAAGGEAFFLVTDTRKRENVIGLINTTVKKFGRIDILVNNAALMLYKMFEECTIDDFNDVMETNFRGYLYTMWEALPYMKKQNGGCVINISSINSSKANPGQSIYSGFKAAINQATRCLAQEYARYNIRMNLILPGPVRTNMIPYELGGTEEEIWEKVAETVPLKRVGEPEDIANVALFLASNEASFITGASYVVDGGII